MDTINIAILDDHQIVIDGLKLLLECSSHLKVVLEHTNGMLMLDRLREGSVRVDVVLLDLIMPELSGLDFAVIAAREFPEIKIIVLSMSNEGNMIYELIENAEIKGYLPKSVNRVELVEAIDKVHHGGQYFTEEVLEDLRVWESNVRVVESARLSSRESEIIALIAKGLTNKQLAQRLFISEKTVETHRKNILRKTGTHNAGSLIEYAIRHKLI